MINMQEIDWIGIGSWDQNRRSVQNGKAAEYANSMSGFCQKSIRARINWLGGEIREW